MCRDLDGVWIGLKGQGGEPFRFFNCIAENQKFIPLIEECWNKSNEETHMRRIWSKLKVIKQELKKTNIGHFQDVEKRLKNTRK